MTNREWLETLPDEEFVKVMCGSCRNCVANGDIKKKDFMELQYVLSKAFDRHGMDAKEVAMDLVVAGYGKIITLEKQCNELIDDNKELQSSLDMYILKCLSLKHELEGLKNANSKRSKSDNA